MRIFLIKQLFIVLLLTVLHFDSTGQSCSCISGGKDKKTGVETYSGITNSEHYYSLMISREVRHVDTTTLPKFILFLNAASRFVLSDSMLKTVGTIELQLLDNTTVICDSVIFFNNPLGFCCTIGFKTYLKEEQIRLIAANPIVTLTVIDMLKTSFSNRRQKEQQKIINCLLQRK
jgi:hypothetical protein